MIEPLHDRKSFFKYYSAESALLTLENTTRKWSTPLTFNDPFDNQFDLHLEQPNEELARKQAELFFERLRTPKPFTANEFGQLTPQLELLRKFYSINPSFKHKEADIDFLVDGMLEGMQNAFKMAPETNKDVRLLMNDTSIFCLSETHDNLLMWSHYADNHNGAVIEFLSLQEVDSPLILAQPVNYTLNMPRMNFEALQSVESITKDTLERITLTKSKEWAYEREWRIITTLKDKGQTSEILPYAPEE